MAKVFNDIILGFWGLIISLLSRVKDIFTTENGNLNILGFILLVLIIMTILELGLDAILPGGDEEWKNIIYGK